MAAMSSAMERAQSDEAEDFVDEEDDRRFVADFGVDNKGVDSAVAVLTLTHSWWRGDLSRVALAQSCAEAGAARAMAQRNRIAETRRGKRVFHGGRIAEKQGIGSKRKAELAAPAGLGKLETTASKIAIATRR